MTLNQELQEYRQQAGLSQIKLAKRMGYKSAQMVSNIERGLCGIPLPICKKYLKAINYPYGRYKVVLMHEFDKKLDKYLGR